MIENFQTKFSLTNKEFLRKLPVQKRGWTDPSPQYYQSTQLPNRYLAIIRQCLELVRYMLPTGLEYPSGDWNGLRVYRPAKGRKVVCTLRWIQDYKPNTFLPLLRPLQFNYLSYELFLGKKSCQTPKKKKKKVIFGVLRTKVVLKFSVRLQKKKKSASFKNILCKCDLINYRKLSLL